MMLYNDIMPYFDKCIHVKGWNLSKLWSPLKMWAPEDFTSNYFGHPVSKSWPIPCSKVYHILMLHRGDSAHTDSISSGRHFEIPLLLWCAPITVAIALSEEV